MLLKETLELPEILIGCECAPENTKLSILGPAIDKFLERIKLSQLLLAFVFRPRLDRGVGLIDVDENVRNPAFPDRLNRILNLVLGSRGIWSTVLALMLDWVERRAETRP